MNIDHHFDEACFLLDTATAIFQTRTKSRFADAQEKYEKAKEIYNNYFAHIDENSVDDFEF